MAKRRGLSFYRRRKKIRSTLVREIFSWIFGIAVSIFIAAVLVYFFGMQINVVGTSMEPTLYNEQVILLDRFSYTFSAPKAGDVVAFLPNGNENSHYYVKRIAAVPGDTICITDGTIYVNGEALEWATDKILDAGIAENELTLGSGEYFCIGDNANNSEDSRSANIGTVNTDYIIGRAWLRLRSEEAGTGLVE